MGSFEGVSRHWRELFACTTILFMRTNKSSVANPAEVQERILEAALHAFAEKGFDGATTREIASRAKLWQAAVDRAFGEIRGALDAAHVTPTGDDALAAVRAGIRAHVHYVARNPEFVCLMYDEGKRRGPRMRWLVDRHVKPMFERLILLVRHLQGLGRLPDDIAPLHFAYALIGAIDVIFHQVEECRRVTGVDPMDPAVVEAHARTVEHMFLGSASS